MEAMRIYWKLIRISMQGKMQYRADFVTGIISVILLNAVQLGLIGILVSRFLQLNGWSAWDLVMLYGIWMLSHSIYSMFFWHLSTLEDYLIQGTFDQFLTRPISPLVQFLGREIQYMGVGDILVGVSCLSLSYTRLGLDWGVGEWSFLFLAVLAGTVIEFSISWIVSCMAFWFGRAQTGIYLVNRLYMMVQQYPADIFGGWFRMVITGLIPVAFMNYYPALVLLDKKEKLGSCSWLAYGSPAVAAILLLMAVGVWRAAILRYSSSGS